MSIYSVPTFLKQSWWKILSVVILSYVLIAGMLTPLKPGILDASPLKVDAGTELVMDIEGYNSHFTEAKKNTAYLKNNDQQVIKASKFEVSEDNLARLTFSIPPSGAQDQNFSATLITNNEIDGSAILPQAIQILKNSNSSNTASWGTFDVIGLHKIEAFRFPFRNTLHETVRNTFFHVAIWMAMFILFIIGLVYSIKYLRKPNPKSDAIALAVTEIGVVYGVIGLLTGSIWAKYTWGAYWTNDVKLNMAAISMLLYAAYLIFRATIEDPDRRARVAAAYNVFAFVIVIPLIFIIPRMTESLHPGNGGNPALGGEDLDNSLRMIFYPAIIGLTFLGLWIASVRFRIRRIVDASIS